MKATSASRATRPARWNCISFSRLKGLPRWAVDGVSNVDVGSAKEMVKLLESMRDAGKTIFVVTHQASLLEGAADEFVWMQAGQIVGRTRELQPVEVR